MQVNEQIIKVLEYLGEKVGVAIDWTAENVMPYLEDLLSRFVKFNIVSEIMRIIIALIFVIGVGITTYKLCKYGIKKLQEDRYSSWDIGAPLVGIFGGVCEIMSIIWFFVSIFTLLKWIFIPEMQIFDYIHTLIGCG